MKRAILLLLLPLALAACDTRALAGGGAVGTTAPDYGAVTLDGDSVSLAALRGRLVLLNIWATWCPPCREEIPALQRLHERHAAAGLEVVGVSIDSRGEGENIRTFLEGYGVTYPIWHDPVDRVTTSFRAQGVPTTVLIDREGTVIWRHVGPVTDDDETLNRLIVERA
jgi:thiol-disulfide isomerase/thioredoxin